MAIEYKVGDRFVNILDGRIIIKIDYIDGHDHYIIRFDKDFSVFKKGYLYPHSLDNNDITSFFKKLNNKPTRTIP